MLSTPGLLCLQVRAAVGETKQSDIEKAAKLVIMLCLVMRVCDGGGCAAPTPALAPHVPPTLPPLDSPPASPATPLPEMAANIFRRFEQAGHMGRAEFDRIGEAVGEAELRLPENTWLGLCKNFKVDAAVGFNEPQFQVFFEQNPDGLKQMHGKLFPEAEVAAAAAAAEEAAAAEAAAAAAAAAAAMAELEQLEKRRKSLVTQERFEECIPIKKRIDELRAAADQR